MFWQLTTQRKKMYTGVKTIWASSCGRQYPPHTHTPTVACKVDRHMSWVRFVDFERQNYNQIRRWKSSGEGGYPPPPSISQQLTTNYFYVFNVVYDSRARVNLSSSSLCVRVSMLTGVSLYLPRTMRITCILSKGQQHFNFDCWQQEDHDSQTTTVGMLGNLANTKAHMSFYIQLLRAVVAVLLMLLLLLLLLLLPRKIVSPASCSVLAPRVHYVFYSNN